MMKRAMEIGRGVAMRQRGFCISGAQKVPAEGLSVLEKAVIGCGFGAVIFGATQFLLEFPEPLEIFWDRVKNDDKVLEEFGNPVSKGLFWDGLVDEWAASATLTIYGDKSSGTAYGRLIKNHKNGEWEPVLIVAKSQKHIINVYEKK